MKQFSWKKGERHASNSRFSVRAKGFKTKLAKRLDRPSIRRVREFGQKYLGHSLVICAFLAIALNLFIELLARKTPGALFHFVLGSPFVFFYNALIIFATLSVALLFKRRGFFYTLISIIWMALGITNGVILGFRTTPFTMTDILLMDSVWSIIPNYLSTVQIILVGILIVVALGLLVVLFFKAPKYKKSYRFWKSAVAVAVVFAALVGGTQFGTNSDRLATVFGNLNYAYRDYGVPYCFLNTWLNTGIQKPKNYSEAMIQSILTEDELAGNHGTSDDPAVNYIKGDTRTPNIIFLQLESFFDPTLVKGWTFSEDPIPNFHALEERYSSGFFRVPALGAGTANTEFESITGMRARFFGPGEYPYKSILRSTTAESMCYDLKELGYGTHAIHSHRGVFYGRNEVYKNLGFDTFTSLEYMNGVEKTPRNWAKDYILTGEIMAALQSTESKDYIYAVSVQGHGQYPTKQVIKDPAVTVGGIEDDGERWKVEYYVNQIHEMDEFVGQLTKALSEFDEDAVLVMYGDHLPGLDLTADMIKNGDLYETQYIIWSNFRMKKIDRDLNAYQIGATLLGRLGIDNGILTKFHQTQQGKGNYIDNLQALEYDMLYGQHYIYGGTVPFQPTNMKMGIRPIKVNEAFEISGHKYIKGENFTEFSHIVIDGELVDTVYLDPQTLRIPDGADISDLSKIKVSQIEKNNAILSTTE